MIDLRRRTVLLLSIAALALGAGCAAGATAQGMTAGPAARAPAEGPLRGAVAVLPVRGGRATHRLLGSRIAGSDFEQALVESLRLAAFLAPSEAEARFALQAEIVEAETVDHNPLLVVTDTSQTVDSTIHYLLTDRRSGAVLLDRRIEVPYTAPGHTSMITEKRNQLAQEGSARESIETLLDELAAIRATEPDASGAPDAGAPEATPE